MCICGKNLDQDLHGVLWDISTKLRGMGEMFVMANGEIPVSESAFTGIGYLLEGFADDLDGLTHQVDNQKLQPSLDDVEEEKSEEDE